MNNILLLALLALLAVSNATPANFPHGLILTYNYTVDVKSGIIEPAPYASQFFINSTLRVQHYDKDPTLQNAYYVQLLDVKHQLFNGRAVHSDAPQTANLPLPDAAKAIELPFVIVFHNSGLLQGVKFVKEDIKWSENIKRSIASILQLDLRKIFMPDQPDPTSFITEEDTIHGSCRVFYTVDKSIPINTLERSLRITKYHEPMKCSVFSYHTFSHVENEKCYVTPENDMSTASRRVFEISFTNEKFVIEKIIGHGVINRFPWLARAEAHYLLTNQTMILNDVKPMPRDSEMLVIDTPIQGVTYSKPTTFYSGTGDLDVTQGRHSVDVKGLVDTLMKMLNEAADYLKQYHMDVKPPEWKNGQTINRISQVMSFMSVETLKDVYDRIQKLPANDKDKKMSIFLGIVPNVGTTATCLFTRDLVRYNNVSQWTALEMLSLLPMHVKMPSTQLLVEMLPLLHLDETVPLNVRNAVILCYSTLIHKTFVNRPVDDDLTKYVKEFGQRIENEETDEMIVVFIMALKNVGSIHTLPILSSIISSERYPEHIRAQAIWGIKKVIVDFSDRAHNLLWPILANTGASVALRIAAYDVWISQMPDLERLMKIYWFMVYERDEHLYNYHVETIKGLSESVDPCLAPVREMARKILRYTRMRGVPGRLSTNGYVDSFDHTYGHGEGFKYSLLINQWTGLPFMGSVNYVRSFARRPANRLGVHWYMNGGMMASSKLHGKKDFGGYIYVTLNDNVVVILHYHKITLTILFQALFKGVLQKTDKPFIYFDDHFEMHVPTDSGLPAILTKKTPTVDAFNNGFDVWAEDNLTKIRWTHKYQEWKHGEHAMIIYNPFDDIWHSISRTGSRDIVVPTKLTITNDSSFLNITSPRLPMDEYSTVGLATQAKNFAIVLGDKSGALKKSCPSCLYIQNVTGVVSNKTYMFDYHSKDTSLRYFSGIYNCEGRATPLPVSDLHQAFSMYNDLTDIKECLKFVIKLSEISKNNMISSQGASCSNLNKIEPSARYPASHVIYALKDNRESMYRIEPYLFKDMMYNFHGVMDVKSSHDETIRKWDADLTVTPTMKRTVNFAKIVLTRTTPGETNLVMCIDAVKEYPKIYTDHSNLETKTRINIVMGRAENVCVNDEMDIVINIKGEKSEEQLNREYHDKELEACYEGINTVKFGCLRETILETTLRKYTTNVTLNKVPLYVVTYAHILQDLLLSRFYPHLTYISNNTDFKNLKFVTEFSAWLPRTDVTVVQPFRSYQLLQLPYGNTLWNIWMDNIFFNVATLTAYVMYS